jgi:transposase
MMPRVTKAAPHLNEAEIDPRLTRAKSLWRIRRWMSIRHALVAPQPARVIARHVGVAKQTVHNLMAAYNRHGPAAVDTPGRGQRQRAYRTLAEERALLAPFVPQARVGQRTTRAPIKAALEARRGHRVHAATVYRLLHRHGHRQLVPRPRHGAAAPEAQAACKKTSLPSSPPHWPSVSPQTRALASS